MTIDGGTGVDTVTLTAVTATVDLGAGVDSITLTGSDDVTVTLEYGLGDTGTPSSTVFETVVGFTVGHDITSSDSAVTFAFDDGTGSATATDSAAKIDGTSGLATFSGTLSLADQLTDVVGAMALITDTGSTAWWTRSNAAADGVDTYVFINGSGTDSALDSTDIFIKLEGFDGTLGTADDTNGIINWG